MADRQLKANLAIAYNQNAEERDKSEIDDWKAAERAHFLSLLREGNKRTLLELGAGPGRDSVFFRTQGLEVTCIDLSPKMIELCQQKGINAYVMDIVHLDFGRNSFDAVYALNSFLHLPKDEFPIALENVRNVLRLDGLFYLGLYGGIEFADIWEKDSYTPKRFFSFHTDETLKRILTNIFEILHFKHIDFEEGEMGFQSVVLRKPVAEQKGADKISAH
jgi:SAM-dependent methyltransferase